MQNLVEVITADILWNPQKGGQLLKQTKYLKISDEINEILQRFHQFIQAFKGKLTCKKCVK
jgi:hypothetical protein